MMSFSKQQLMIIAAAREIRDNEVVFVGMRLPITAFGVAKLTHAPNAVGLFECGIVRNQPAKGDALYHGRSSKPERSGLVQRTGPGDGAFAVFLCKSNTGLKRHRRRPMAEFQSVYVKIQIWPTSLILCCYVV